MIMASVKYDWNPPKFNFQEDLRVVAKTVIIPILAENINNQESLNETPLPELELETVAAKILKGQSEKKLIATGKLIRSFIFKDKGKSSVVITLNSERKDIGKYLQIDGVGKKNKKFIFFGISTRMEKSAVNYMKNKIKEQLNARGQR